MNSDQFYRARLQFIGKALAICTHEIRNHLAIIRESAGLIMDTLEFGDSKTDISKPLNNIDKQALRSASFLGVLSSFCHRLDHEPSAYSLNQLIDELITLLGRNLNQREIVIDKDYHKDIHPIEGYPAIIQFILFCIIERLQDKTHLKIATKEAGSQINIMLTYDKHFKDASKEPTICAEGLIEDACRIASVDLHMKLMESILMLQRQKGGIS